MNLPECPVERQLIAYNARDIDAFMACFAPDVRVEDGHGALRIDGWEAKRERYAAAFEREPTVHCKILSRIRYQDYVVDHEELTGYQDGSTRYAVAIYRVNATLNLIEHIRFL